MLMQPMHTSYGVYCFGVPSVILRSSPLTPVACFQLCVPCLRVAVHGKLAGCSLLCNSSNEGLLFFWDLEACSLWNGMELNLRTELFSSPIGYESIPFAEMDRICIVIKKIIKKIKINGRISQR